MSTQLTSYKRLLTQYCNKLEAILARAKEDQSETQRTNSNGAPTDDKEFYSSMQEALGAIEAYTAKIEQLYKEYRSALDNLASVPSNSDSDDFEQYSTRAEAILSSAFDMTVVIQGRIRTFTSTKGRDSDSPHSRASTSAQQDDSPRTQRIDLPAIPIPTFSGNIWDWDNFWILFNANVHTQPLPPLFKFNHLLSALKGEPRNAIMRFQVTDHNYQKAIDFLHAKYGNQEELVHHLTSRLETAALRSASIKEQRVLLDQLHVIVSQLRDKGEQVDSQWLLKQVLAKFPEQLQRRVLEKKYSMEGSFLMDNLLNTLDQLISCEEKIAIFTSHTSTPSTQYPRKEKPSKAQFPRGGDVCMYCGGDHKAKACTKYGTPQERANYLREHKLCFICASAQHATSDCKKRPCFACQGKHHTSCCFKATTSPATSAPQGKPATPARTKEKPKFTQKSNPTSTTAHQLSNHDQDHFTARIEQQEDPVAQLHSTEGVPSTRETYLPIGELTVMDPSSRELRKVPALLDSGAECSFIDHKLAEELRLPTLGTTTLRVRTFGSNRVQECVSRKVPLEMWDDKGKLWSLELLTHETLTSTLRTPPVFVEDVAFIKAKNSDVNLVRAQATTKPLIVLGSDQLWQLIRHDEARIRLPSGLYLLPTHLGYLLTGQVIDTLQHPPVQEKEEARRDWSQSGSIKTGVNTFSIEDPEEVQPKEAALQRNKDSDEARVFESVFVEEHDQLRTTDKENEKKLSEMQQQINELTMEVARLKEELQGKEAERSSDPLEVIVTDDDHWQRIVEEGTDDDPMEQIPALVSDVDDEADDEDPGELDPQSVEGSEADQAEAEDVVRDVQLDDVEEAGPGPPDVRAQQEDVENVGSGPEVRVQQDDVEETDPGPEVRVQQVNVEEADLGPEVRVGQGNGQIDGREAELIERVQAVEFKIQRVRMQFSRFSFRRSEWRSPGMPPDLVCAFYGEVGIHYSESRPRITDGDERYDIIGQDGACFRYMDFCPGGQRSKCRHKRCFDYQRMGGTAFEDLIPKDEGHHWALGNVLHKELASQRIQELEDDGRRRTGLWQFFSEQRNQQGRRTTSTRAGVTTSRLHERISRPIRPRARALGSPHSPGYFSVSPEFQGFLRYQRFQSSFLGSRSVERLCASGEDGLRGALHSARVRAVVSSLRRVFSRLFYLRVSL